MELAASAGLHLDPWQVDVLDVALRERRDGTWASREVALICPRQNGKGSVLEAVELAGLFLFGEELILHSAHEFKTAAEAYLRIKSLIQATPDLERLVNRFHNAHGSEGIELKDGRRLRFVARTGGSGRGFSGDRIILDEAYNLADRSVSALAFTMAARPNPQVWYTSSAPLPEENSGVLRRVCKRGRAGDSSMAYIEFCASDGADLDDPDEWAAANPGFPHRISAETIEVERGMVLDEDFARERLGLWRDEDVHEQLIPFESWRDCCDPASTISGRPCLAFDVTPDRSAAAIGAAGLRGDGRMHVEVIEHHRGTGWVAGRLAELVERHGAAVFCDPSGPAGGLLSQVKIDVQLVNTREHAQACGAFFDGFTELAWRHLGQVELNEALVGADRRPLGDAWLWSRKSSSVDICPLVAVTLAAHGVGKPSDEPADADFYLL